MSHKPGRRHNSYNNPPQSRASIIVSKYKIGSKKGIETNSCFLAIILPACIHAVDAPENQHETFSHH